MKLLRNLTIGVVSIFLATSTASAQVNIGAGVSSLGGGSVDLTGGAIDVTGKFNEYLGWSLSSQIGGSDSDGLIKGVLNLYMLHGEGCWAQRWSGRVVRDLAVRIVPE